MADSFASQECSRQSNSRRLPAFNHERYIEVEREDQALAVREWFSIRTSPDFKISDCLRGDTPAKLQASGAGSLIPFR